MTTDISTPATPNAHDTTGELAMSNIAPVNASPEASRLAEPAKDEVPATVAAETVAKPVLEPIKQGAMAAEAAPAHDAAHCSNCAEHSQHASAEPHNASVTLANGTRLDGLTFEQAAKVAGVNSPANEALRPVSNNDAIAAASLKPIHDDALEAAQPIKQDTAPLNAEALKPVANHELAKASKPQPISQPHKPVHTEHHNIAHGHEAQHAQHAATATHAEKLRPAASPVIAGKDPKWQAQIQQAANGSASLGRTA